MSQGQSLMAEAEKMAKGGGGLFSMFGGADYAGAVEKYKQAANQFQLAKDWKMAGTCFQKAYQVTLKDKDSLPSEKARLMEEAGKVFKRVEMDTAMECYQTASTIWSEAGRFQNAAKTLKSCAEMLEEEYTLEDPRPGELYEKAADLYDMDDHSKVAAQNCWLKVAESTAYQAASVSEREARSYYDKAIKIYEKAARGCMQSTTMSFNAKKYFLKAGFLWLALGDGITAKKNQEKYFDEDPRFQGSREGNLLETLSQAFMDEDTETFVQALGDFDNITKLENFDTRFLLIAKRHLPEAAKDNGGGHPPMNTRGRPAAPPANQTGYSNRGPPPSSGGGGGGGTTDITAGLGGLDLS